MIHLFYTLGAVIPYGAEAYRQMGADIRAPLDYDARTAGALERRMSPVFGCSAFASARCCRCSARQYQVDALALVAPVLSGRRYLREARTAQLAA